MTVRRFVGLDLGGTNIKTVVIEATDKAVEVVSSSTAPTRSAVHPESSNDSSSSGGMR